MTYSAKILCDSISSVGVRLTTIAVTMPRFILAEFNTHRMLSRNSASSRAIPLMVDEDALDAAPYMPAYCGNFRLPWKQYRKMIDGEKIFKGKENK